MFSLESSRMGGEITTSMEHSAKAGLCKHEHTSTLDQIIVLGLVNDSIKAKPGETGLSLFVYKLDGVIWYRKGKIHPV